MRVTIAAQLQRDGYTTEQIMDLFKLQEGFNSKETMQGILSAKPERTAKCETIKEYGYCLYPDSMKNAHGVNNSRNNSKKIT